MEEHVVYHQANARLQIFLQTWGSWSSFKEGDALHFWNENGTICYEFSPSGELITDNEFGSVLFSAE